MSIAQTTASVKPRPCGGVPLAVRVAEALLSDEYAFAFEFEAQGGEEVYGCYRAADLSLPVCTAAYALEAVGGVVTSCNCPDRECRKRTCKHMQILALVLGYGTPAPAFFAAPETPAHPGVRLHAPVLAASALPDDWASDWK